MRFSKSNRLSIRYTFVAFLTVLMHSSAWGDAPVPRPAASVTPTNRVASVFVSQDFINEQIAAHSKSPLVKDLKVSLDPKGGKIILHGRILVPTEEMRAMKLDPKLGAYRFQLTIKPETTKGGHLILDFPLSETYFYPADSDDPKNDRVIIPVQLLSLALASVRGYMAALSGDFSGFDQRTEKYKALIKALDRAIGEEKNQDALDDLKNQRESLRIQLEAVPIERKQLQAVSKEVEHILGFTGEKELNLNEELAAKKNALVLKIKLSQLAPFLKGVELGGVRLILDKKDGNGENYMAVDINSELEGVILPPAVKQPSNRPPMKFAPSLIMRLNQSLFESEAVVDGEKKEIGAKITDLEMALRDDGLHVAGKYHALLFHIPFDTAVDFVTTGLDQFEVRVRKIDIAGINLEFLSGFVLEMLQKKLDRALAGICKFKYVGEEKDGSRALQVNVEPKALVPAFPELHLVAVDVRDGEFLLKIGKQ